ncbi:MAG: hypothetical protein ACFFCT_10380 [Candidatus Odinarchaeota archaeon]
MTHHHFDDDMDIHKELLPFSEVLAFLEEVEADSNIKKYFNGSNESGRWIFQIYNREFIEELASVINRFLECQHGHDAILEVMCGDGRLTEFLQPFVHREIIATDARDGRYAIPYPKWVRSSDALESIERHKPSFIVLSWEPYLSMVSIDIVQKEIPTAWIGNPEMCGHPDLFQIPHIPLKSPYALSRHDSFRERRFKTDIFLFNCDLNGAIETK